MTHCFIVSYDLCTPGRNYDGLYKALKSFSYWGRLTESTWAVVSHTQAIDIREYLRTFIDKNDRLIVIQSGCNAAWQNTIASSEWVKQNIIK